MTNIYRTDIQPSNVEVHFNNLDNMKSPENTNPTFVPPAYNEGYHHQQTSLNDYRQTTKSKTAKFCGGRCLIGLGIGLAIGLVLVIVIAVPVGVVKRNSLGTISSTPNWIGTFKVDDACSSTTCCCVSGEVKISSVSNTEMQIKGSLTGQCGTLPSTISLTEQMPSNFHGRLTVQGVDLSFQLGQDSSYVMMVNINYPYCSGSALRTSYNAGNTKYINLNLILFALLISIWLILINNE